MVENEQSQPKLHQQ